MHFEARNVLPEELKGFQVGSRGNKHENIIHSVVVEHEPTESIRNLPTSLPFCIYPKLVKS